MQNKPIVMLGAGGHAKVLLSLLQQQGITVAAVCAPQRPASARFDSIPFLTSDDDVLRFKPQDVMLVNGIGALPGQTVRRRLFEHFSALGYSFFSVIASSAVVDSGAQIGQGVQVLPGAIINTDAILHANVLINSGAIIEHDCVLHPHTVVSPGAVLCGGVTCGDNSYIGAGATVIQSQIIGANALVGAGSTVVCNLLDNQKIYSARPFIKAE
ncbi:acetyltransferase [Arsukibacterium sp. UBA3155]|uniref:acetyltransferase n=1 Tax=Arsukibacterium sp. UBA3155 TaxID=1946058 RepID=UPI0025C3DB82|nr:acetyltransferase [Arsukibacterium sp. UBA3155]